MTKKLIIRGVTIALLLTLCLVAGRIGGLGFPPDVNAIHRLEAIRTVSPLITETAIAITQAGSAYGTVSVGFAVVAWLVWRGQRWLAVVLGVTVIGERLVIDGMKLLIDRSRPAFDLHPVVTHSSSFPSGHAGNSMAVFLSIALIAVPRAHRSLGLVAALLASFIIGTTRPYLGVHWPSDVVGGWSLGAAIAIIAWTLSEERSAATP
jgi:membrane-associated phospholipid phosphatase